jgi:phosphohistidine phosphatase SixA
MATSARNIQIAQNSILRLHHADRGAFQLLRLGAAFCFIGHGAFGLLRKPGWISYFDVFGIEPAAANALMPLVGTVDIAVGIITLVSPLPAVLLYMTGWAMFTALLRPLAGEPVWETLERAGNYGVPLALLVLANTRALASGWLAPMRAGRIEDRARGRAVAILRWSTVALLAGHGALGAFTRKPLLAEHYATIGANADILPFVGVFELILAAAVAIQPRGALLIVVAAWKLATEFLFIAAAAPAWEFIERAGSYAAPLALWLLAMPSTSYREAARRNKTTRVSAVTAAVLASILTLPAAASGQLTSDLLHQLRSGGYVLVMRHAITDRSRMDRSPVDFADRSTQRNLSEAGIEQAKTIGRDIEALRIPLGAIHASAYARATETADLAFGRVQIDSALHLTRREAELRRLLTERPEPGSNRLLVTHNWMIARVLPYEPGQIAEGEVVVIQPTGEGEFRIVARIRSNEWKLPAWPFS